MLGLSEQTDLTGSIVRFVGICTAVQSQKAVSAHFTSEQILPFGFAERYRGIFCSAYPPAPIRRCI